MNNDVNLRIQNLTILVRNIKTYYQVRAALCSPGVLCSWQCRPANGFPTGSPEEMCSRSGFCLLTAGVFSHWHLFFAL